MRNVFSIALLAVGLCLPAAAQVVNPANKKFNVYKIDVNPAATKDGIRGIAVFFSCEYLMAEAEYNGLKDKQNKVRMTFYPSLTDANGEPVYQAYDYPAYKKTAGYTALHFADEIVLMPQNKAQGLRSTGIELFVPFAQTSLPEGTSQVTLALNAYNEKAGRFENIHTRKLAVSKPATYAVTLQPKQITLLAKGGKRLPAGRLEQDVFALPGTRKDARDVASAANVDVAEALQFTYCEGDAMRLAVRPSTSTGQLRRNKPRLLRTPDNQPLPAFDNAAALPGEWPFDEKAAGTVTLKNNALEVVMAVQKYKVPAVQLSGFKVNPFATHEGVAGTSVSFEYKAAVATAVAMPPLKAWLTYQARNAEETATVRNGKVTGGPAKLDTSGTLVLNKAATSGKVEVFYPAYQILLQDPDVRRQPAKRFAMQVRLGDNPYVIVRKETRLDLTLQTVREAVLPAVVKLRDTLVGGVPGAALSLPYALPALYFGTPEQKTLQIVDGGKDNKATGLLRKMTLLGDDAQRVNATAKTGVEYRMARPKGAVRLFLPYTSLTKIEEKPLPFRMAVLVTDGAGSVNVGESVVSLHYPLDRAKLRFISVGITEVRLKQAESGLVAWRIRSKDKVLYESKPIPAAKLIENLYTDAFYMHETDVLAVELLKGPDAAGLKPVIRWEKPVKSLTASEQITIDPAKTPGTTDDGDTKSITIGYTAQ